MGLNIKSFNLEIYEMTFRMNKVNCTNIYFDAHLLESKTQQLKCNSKNLLICLLNKNTNKGL